MPARQSSSFLRKRSATLNCHCLGDCDCDCDCDDSHSQCSYGTLQQSKGANASAKIKLGGVASRAYAWLAQTWPRLKSDANESCERQLATGEAASKLTNHNTTKRNANLSARWRRLPQRSRRGKRKRRRKCKGGCESIGGSWPMSQQTLPERRYIDDELAFATASRACKSNGRGFAGFGEVSFGLV